MIPTTADTDRSIHPARRLLAAVLGLILLGSLATACTSDNSGNSGNSGGETSGADAYYPHTMSTRHGNVTIEKKPERVVALSAATADRLLALGVTPVAVTTEGGDLSSSAPWLEGKLDGVTVSDAYNYKSKDYEKIASFRPDLIIGLISDEEDFTSLSAIAPTVTPDSPDANPNWELQFTTTAEAVNHSSDAESWIAEIKKSYAAVGDKVTGIENMTYNWIAFSGKDSVGLGNGSLLQLFGLKPNQDERQQGRSSISRENMGQLDGDFLGVWTSDRSAAESDSSFRELPAVKKGHVYWADNAVAGALNQPSPMAVEWLLGKLGPSVEALGD